MKEHGVVKEIPFNVLLLTSYSLTVDTAGLARLKALNDGFNKNNVESRIQSVFSNDNNKLSKLIIPQSIRWPFAAFRLRQDFFKKRNTIIYLYTENFLFSFVVIILAKIYKARICVDLCEWFGFSSFVKSYRNIFIGIINYIRYLMFRNLVINFADGLVCISNYIKDKVHNKKANIIVVPAIFNMEDIQEIQSLENKISPDDNKFNIFYSGSFKHYEAFENFITAAISLIEDVPDMAFVICGPLSEQDILSMSKESGIALPANLFKKVNVKGLVSRTEYISELLRSQLILLPRTDSPEARASFPTRLPEYLISSRPIICNSQFDIVNYLSPGKHYIEADFSSSDDIVKNVLLCFSEYDSVRNIGIQGRERAMKCFSNIYHCSKLKMMFEHLLGNC